MVVVDFGLHLPGDNRVSAPGGQLQTSLRHHPTISHATHSGSRQQSLAEACSALWGGHLYSWSSTEVAANYSQFQPISANWPEGKQFPLTCQQHSRLKYKGGCTQSTLGCALGVSSWGNREAELLDSTGYLLWALSNKIGRHSSSLYKSKQRETAKMRICSSAYLYTGAQKYVHILGFIYPLKSTHGPIDVLVFYIISSCCKEIKTTKYTEKVKMIWKYKKNAGSEHHIHRNY